MLSDEWIVDLCCGRGGWTDAFLDAGFRVVGFDVMRFDCYRGELVLQDIRTVDGARLRGCRLVVASPPCQEFARHGMPWTRARANPEPDVSIVSACRRIAEEAGAPLILENVRTAQKFIGRAVTHWDAFYLWGDGVPALLPMAGGKSWKEKIPGTRPDLRAVIPPELAGHIARCCVMQTRVREVKRVTSEVVSSI